MHKKHYTRLVQSCSVAVLFVASAISASGASCKVLPGHSPSDVEIVFQKGDHAKAQQMLETELAKTPNDPDETALLVRALLWQQKTSEAAEAVTKALAVHPDSPSLLTEQAEVLFREGKPWEVGSALAAALKADPCFPRAYIIFDWLMSAESNRLSAYKAIQLAHQLDPNDSETLTYWMNTLPLTERIQVLEAEISSGRVTDSALLDSRKKYLDALKKLAAEPPKSCHLVSHQDTSEAPLLAILGFQYSGALQGSLQATAYGLNVGINGHQELLELDTGASGLVISKAAAEHAGLKFTEVTKVGGIGDEGPQGAHLAYADSIQIGSLEFKDCAVIAADKIPGGGDGLVGADVFMPYLVTIDYPMHKLILSQLPPRPNQTQEATPSLATGGADAVENKPAESAAGSSTSTATNAQLLRYDRYIAPEMKDYVPIYRVGHNLIMPGTLHKPDIQLFLLDTGAWATQVTPDAAREVTKVDMNTGISIVGMSGKVEHPYVAEALDVTFGGISKRLLGVPAFAMDAQSMYSAMKISGLIGSDILEELTIHIDYRDGLVKFEYDPKRGYHPLNR